MRTKKDLLDAAKGRDMTQTMSLVLEVLVDIRDGLMSVAAALKSGPQSKPPRAF